MRLGTGGHDRHRFAVGGDAVARVGGDSVLAGTARDGIALIGVAGDVDAVVASGAPHAPVAR